MSPSGQRLASRVWLLVAGGGVASIGIALAGVVAVDQGGGALLFLGLILLPTGLFAWNLYRRRAAILERLTGGEVLLRWPGPGGAVAALARDGALIDGELHTWGHSTARLEQARLDEGARRLTLVYSIIAGRGGHRARTQLELEVPAGREAEARRAVDALAVAG